jgi:hypothetical protein
MLFVSECNVSKYSSFIIIIIIIIIKFLVKLINLFLFFLILWGFIVRILCICVISRQ